MPRYVVLRHEMPPDAARPLHWDFMLETDAHLRTWALADEPESGRSIVAEMLPDHRPAYLDYEGPVSKNRGVVSQWDAGTFVWQRLTAEEVLVTLAGQRLRGTAHLRCDAESRGWKFAYLAE